MARWLAAADRAGGGLAVDLGLYAASAAFAAITAVTATLPPHAAWGRIAIAGYLGATVLVLVQLTARNRRTSRAGSRLASWPARAGVTVLAFAATTLLPLIEQAVARAGGHAGRAQEEVVVVEHAGQRLLDTGTPYLGRTAIAALAPDDRLLGYLPYQPGMALFGVPRAVLGAAWYTDARVWFALVTIGTIGLAAGLVLRAGAGGPAVVRALQAATVLPVCALTLAVGGDDLPVLGLCLLALSLAATGRPGAAGVAVGLAGAMKLFAWPVALVLLALVCSGRTARPRPGPGTGDTARPRPGPGAGGTSRPLRYLLAAVGIPVLSLAPALAVDPRAAIENMVLFPLGRGLVRSPAASPFPGHLVATGLPGGSMIATVLLLAAGLGVAGWLVRRPPDTAGAAALACASGLLAAILLMPSTRFGYLLYPAAYALWAPALAAVPPWPAASSLPAWQRERRRGETLRA